jgi:hypothetical protein
VLPRCCISPVHPKSRANPAKHCGVPKEIVAGSIFSPSQASRISAENEAIAGILLDFQFLLRIDKQQ